MRSLHEFSAQSQRDIVTQCSRYRSRTGRRRRGAAVVLGLFLMVSLIALTAITIDFGFIHVAETEIKRSADATAMAACWEMYEQQVANGSETVMESEVSAAANLVAGLNTVGEESPQLNSGELEMGTYGVDGSWTSGDPTSFNAVRVTLSRQSGSNGELPLFFGSLTGRNSQSLQTTSTAAMFNQISGFYEPEHADETIGILPLALDLPSWLEAVASSTADDFEFTNGTIRRGSDGMHETNLYPKGVGAPGNRGTVDIGGENNSTTDLSRQVLHGISKQDLIDLGKPLQFDANGELDLNGDTGISAGLKDELATLIGKTRVIPIFTRVQGEGDNATFTIVRWEGVRILDVKLTGKKNQKRVIVQPAKVLARGAKIDYTGRYNSTYAVAPVMLVE